MHLRNPDTLRVPSGRKIYCFLSVAGRFRTCNSGAGVSNRKLLEIQPKHHSMPRASRSESLSQRMGRRRSRLVCVLAIVKKSCRAAEVIGHEQVGKRRPSRSQWGESIRCSVWRKKNATFETKVRSALRARRHICRGAVAHRLRGRCSVGRFGLRRATCVFTSADVRAANAVAPTGFQ